MADSLESWIGRALERADETENKGFDSWLGGALDRIQPWRNIERRNGVFLPKDEGEYSKLPDGAVYASHPSWSKRERGDGSIPGTEPIRIRRIGKLPEEYRPKPGQPTPIVSTAMRFRDEEVQGLDFNKDFQATGPRDIRAEEVANRIRAYEPKVAKTSIGRIGQQFATGTTNLTGAIVDPFLDETTADALRSHGEYLQQATAKQYKVGIGERVAGNIAQSAGTMFAAAPAAMLSGGAAAPYVFSGASGAATTRTEYQRALNSGVPAGKAMEFAMMQGGAEAVVSSVLNKFGLPGAEGLLKGVAGQEASKQIGKIGLTGFIAKELVKRGAQEVPEETITKAIQDTISDTYGLGDPESKKIGAWLETAATAFLGGTTLNAPAVVGSAIGATGQLPEASAWAAANPQAVAEMRKKVKASQPFTRGDFKKWGLPMGRDADRRSRFARAVVDAADRLPPRPAAEADSGPSSRQPINEPMPQAPQPQPSQATPTQPQAEPHVATTQAPPFRPTSEWQEVPEGAILPPGIDVRMDMATGRKLVRTQQTPTASIDDSSPTPPGNDDVTTDMPDLSDLRGQEIPARDPDAPRWADEVRPGVRPGARVTWDENGKPVVGTVDKRWNASSWQVVGDDGRIRNVPRANLRPYVEPKETPSAPQAAPPTPGDNEVSVKREEGRQRREDAAPTIGFTTEQGSTYTVDGRSTQRTKAPHVGHDPQDVGEKERSYRTYYVSPEDSQRAGMHGGLSGKKRITVQGDKAYLVSWNEAEKKWGMTAEDKARPIALSTTPQVGMHPLEMFGEIDSHGFKKWHAGSKITEIKTARPQPAATPTPEAPPTPSRLPQSILDLDDAGLRDLALNMGYKPKELGRKPTRADLLAKIESALFKKPTGQPKQPATTPQPGETYAKPPKTPQESQQTQATPEPPKPVATPQTTPQKATAPAIEPSAPEQPATSEQPATTPDPDERVRSHYKRTSGVELGEFVEPGEEHAEAVEFFAERGQQVRFFRSPAGAAAPSFTDLESGVVYLNADRKGDALRYSMAHEFAHGSGADARLADLPDDVLKPYEEKYLKGAAPPYRKKLEADPDMLRREAAASLVGELYQDPNVRARIAETHPTVWDRVVSWTKRLFGSSKSKAVQRVIDELSVKPSRSGGKPPPSKPTATAAPSDEPPRERKTATFAGFDNPVAGTVAGDVKQAVREGMGENPSPDWTAEQVSTNAIATYDADPAAATKSVVAMLSSDGSFKNENEVALANVVVAREAEKAALDGSPAALERQARLERALTLKASSAGDVLRAFADDLFATPEGRKRLVLKEMMALSRSEQKAVDTAMATLKKLGANPSGLLESDGLMLEDVGTTIDAVGRALSKEDSGDTRLKRTAKQDRDVARAQQVIREIDAKAAKRNAKLRAKMERLGYIPTTPEGWKQFSENPNLVLYSLKQIRAWRNAGKGFGSVGGFSPAGILDMIYEYRAANMISTLKSLAKDAAGTPLNWAANMLARVPVATWNSLVGGTHGPRLGEFKHIIQAMIKSIPEAIRNGKNSAWWETSQLDQQSGRHGSAVEHYSRSAAIPGWIGQAVRAPGFGARLFVDDLVRTAIANGEAAGRAYREAIHNDIPADERQGYMDALVADKNSVVWQGEEGETDGGAFGFADKMAFQEQGGETRQKAVRVLTQATELPFGLRWFFVYKKFPINAAVQASEWTPAGLLYAWKKARENIALKKPWSHGMQEDIAKLFIGTLGIAALGAFAMAEDEEREGWFGITGSGHPDPDMRNVIRIGNWKVRYTDIEPLGSALAMWTDVTNAAKKFGLFSPEVPTASIMSLGDTLINKPVMRGVREIADLSRIVSTAQRNNDPKMASEETEKFLARQATSLFPRFVDQFREAADAKQSAYDQRQRRITELLNMEYVGVAAQYDAWGQEKSAAVFGEPTADYLYRLLSPYSVGKKEQHPGDKLIARWNAMQAEKPFRTPERDPQYRRGGKQYVMSPDQFQEYVKVSGQIANELFRRGNYTPDNPTKEQVDALKADFDSSADAAKEYLIAKWAGTQKKPLDVTKLAAEVRKKRVTEVNEYLRGTATLEKRDNETFDAFKKRVAEAKEKRPVYQERRRRLMRTAG
jgi:hypothetical protein